MMEYVASVFLLAGVAAALVSSVGMIRFNNILARMHVVTKVSSFSLLLLMVAVIIIFPYFQVIWKIVVVFFVLIFLSPVSAYLIARVSRREESMEFTTKEK